MAKVGRTRKPSAVLGFIKAMWMILVMLVMLPVWLIRGVVARARFRAELRAAGVPLEAVKRLSNRYKLRLRDLAGIGKTVGAQP